MSTPRQPAQSRRRALASLAVLILALTSVNIGFTVVYVRYVTHEFCAVVTAATATPVQRPADPAATPAREQQWEWYGRFMSLGRHLGC